MKAAREESGITYVDFNTGHYDGDTYLDILEPYIRRVKEETDVMIGVQTPPHSDLARYHELRRMGVNRVSFCFEIWNRDRFVEVCPGKHRQYGLDRYLEAIRYCAQEVGPTGRGFEPWVVNGEIIAGLEPAGGLHPRDRLDHERRRDPDRLRLPAAPRDRLRGARRRRRPTRSCRSSAASTKRRWSAGFRSASRRTSTSRS